MSEEREKWLAKGAALMIAPTNAPIVQAYAEGAMAALAARSSPEREWQPIETCPFVSAKRYLLAHVNGIAFIGYRYREDDHWHAVGGSGRANLKDYPPTHWMEIPDAPPPPGCEQQSPA